MAQAFSAQQASYRFRGHHPMIAADSLERAIFDLIDWWTTRPSLLQHDPGNLKVVLQIGDKQATFEIVDPKILLQLLALDPSRAAASVQEYVLHEMERAGLPRSDVQSVLFQARAVVEVDTIYSSKAPNGWQPDAGQELESALPKQIPILLGAVMREEERLARRDVRRARRGESKAAFEAAVRSAASIGWSDAEISKNLQVPRSTVRDARVRMQRAAERKERAEMKVVKVGRRYTEDDKEKIRDAFKKSRGNAASVARSFGVPERTVREISAKKAPAVKKKKGKSRSAVFAEAREKVIDLVRREGLSPSDAARKVGVSPRTGRDWVRQARLEADEE